MIKKELQSENKSTVKVFISGSRNITKLNTEITEIIDGYIAERYEILIGDCTGADTAVQQFLHEKGYTKVTVYYSGEKPRNNIGRWSCMNIPTEEEKGTFEYRREKDIAMIKECNKGFMIWDMRSKGTYANICDMVSLDKPIVIYTAEVGKMVL